MAQGPREHRPLPPTAIPELGQDLQGGWEPHCSIGPVVSCGSGGSGTTQAPILDPWLGRLHLASPQPPTAEAANSPAKGHEAGVGSMRNGSSEKPAPSPRGPGPWTPGSLVVLWSLE